MADANTTPSIPPEFQYPNYEYSFVVKNFSSDSTNMIVEYTPANTSLTKITISLPILATFDPSTLETYVDRWAPNPKWFAQEIILNHGEILTGANSNVIVS